MRRLITCGILLAAVLLVSGCRTAEPVLSGNDILSVPERTISVQQLAQRLGLTVEQDVGSLVTLRNAANNVMLIPGLDGRVYVNGISVGHPEGLARVGGVLFVPETLEGVIRSALRPTSQSLRPAPAPRPYLRPARPPLARAYRIVVDAGHGGKDPGTISRAGRKEKTITLPVAKELARVLTQDGFDVVLTRRTDVFVELDDRAAVANRAGADLFISIHADACPDPAMRGFAVYTCRGASAASRGVAEAVEGALQGTNIEGLGLRQANYRVLVVSQCPAILVELGYLSNGLDAEILADRAEQSRLARSIADGIADYFSR